jgi:hypothetical protein
MLHVQPSSIRRRILSEFPPISDFRYYAALFRGDFSVEQTMKAHLQDLARSIGCRGLREIQLRKLDKYLASNLISQEDCELLRAVIEDELPAPGRPSHFDVRVQMFDHLPYDIGTLESVVPLPEAVEATRIFRSIFVDCDLLAITAAVGAIEMWYVPLAADLESCYLHLGYTPHQVATYTLHKQADTNHSTAALEFVERYAPEHFHDDIINAVVAGLRSVRLYDDARYIAATDASRSIADYLRLGICNE